MTPEASAIATPLDMTQPLATWVMGIKLRTLIKGVSAQPREGATAMPSAKCADLKGLRNSSLPLAGSTKVSSELASE